MGDHLAGTVVRVHDPITDIEAIRARLRFRA
jgi:hypothetical protein